MDITLTPDQQGAAYLASAVLFIFALKGLTHPATARCGNLLGMLGMAIALGATRTGSQVQDYLLFYQDNTSLIFGDAKDSIEGMAAALKGSGH